MDSMSTAENLVQACMLDIWPTMAECTDFGVNNQETYNAYHTAIRAGEITADQLHGAIISDVPGKILTELLVNAPSNLNKTIVIRTMWDDMKEPPPDKEG